MATTDPAHLMRDLTRDLLLSGRLWRKMARAAAAKHGVSEAASAPLIWIDRLGENVRQNALADAIGIEGASLVRLIDELQASGLVTREHGRVWLRTRATADRVFIEVEDECGGLTPEQSEMLFRALPSAQCQPLGPRPRTIHQP